MKIIDVNGETKSNATRQVDTKYLSKNIDRVRIDPQTSSASRYVQRKTVQQPESGRTGESRISRTESITASTEITSNPTRRLRGPETTTARDTNAAIVTTSELSSRQTGSRSRRGDEPRIVVNGDNNVIVQGDVTTSSSRPQIATRRLTHDLSYVRHDSHWQSHSGFYFSFTWSNSSCGRVAYLPYSYYHSWCSYPIGHYPYYGLSYYYPSYHRRYIYVSLGGYWPSYYRYRRYYWYGCHPYYWYGANVISEPDQNVTYNTYNYYNDEPQPSSYGLSGSAQPYYELGNPDPSKVDVDVPAYESAADLCFANAVELFEAENYTDAVLQLREAVSISPEDIVLPFTYAQALFANGDYALAASVLREAIAQIPEDELTIYYPRGLYKDDAILTEQIKQLEVATAKEPFDSDFQLLLGYQYLGIGELDNAYQPLIEASQSVANVSTAGKLLELAAKLQAEAPKSE